MSFFCRRVLWVNGRTARPAKETIVMLKDKVAVIYGGAGSLGAGVAKAYTQAGARVFLVGRTEATLEKAAAETGAEDDVLAARYEAAVEAHASSVVDRAGRIDISFNLVPRGDFQ